ncbi:MAG: helix-turn-helix transcriptional regulator [Spirochaetales bacterium]|nr:helix-turn-helix transcriptional regulator [Spirochaetales bacterium]
MDVLAQLSGVSKAMLSQIESDKVNPTVATVWKIAQGLAVDIGTLLGGSGDHPRRFTVTRSDRINTLDMDEEGVHIKTLSPLDMVEDLEMYLCTFTPGGNLNSSPHFPKTEEFLTVLSGKIRVTAGDNITECEAGDFIAYHCDLPHSIANIGDSDAVVHMVVRFNKRNLL